ncbi:unnamed protein product [Paramecium pentaurelia]|uniref:Uncharacterized protein n=1 Tax=Paramecium pentaurelia TaxID=43138 RepID=A0A8S1YHC2_9CILI|nr:unnamed protein product [Paramecium pentaurelia]
MNQDNIFGNNQIIKKPKCRNNFNLVNEQSLQSRNIDGYSYCSSYYEKINFQIQFDQQDSISYIKDGQILLKYQINEDFSDDSIINNFDFLQYLIWDGQYYKKQKIGKWTAYWKGNKLDAGGYYNEDGQKIGIWIEPVNIFRDYIFVNFVGEYQQGIRVGNWEYFLNYFNYNIKKIVLHCRGQFNESGIKQGKWIEKSQGISDQSEIINYGEYKNGRKIGIWDTFSNKKLIFSGSYDMNGKKNGQWQDLHQFFDKESNIYYKGKYKENVKYGYWDIELPNYNFIEEYEGKKTNLGGIYDKNGVKNGKWGEIHQKYIPCQVIYIGKYKKGLKVGKWNIVNENENVIGSGKFNKNGYKVGYWREIYYANVIIMYEGKYRSGKRFGRWNILNDNEIIGGGEYDDNEMKQGYWKEFHEYFYDNYDIICKGQYLNNKRIGKWKCNCTISFIMFTKVKKIECGEFDKNGLKNGYWIDISNDFWILHKIIFCGTYKDGFRIGTWEIHQYNKSKQEFEKKGGGDYDENGRKDGTWIDAIINMCNSNLIFIQGEYINGKKNGEFIQIF